MVLDSETVVFTCNLAQADISVGIFIESCDFSCQREMISNRIFFQI